jgi:DNA-binding transcriptional LysR family regulator
VESLYLKTLVEVVRTGSLSRAAEILHVTQPAISRRIKFMEDQYGCELLDRSGNVLRPTEAGRLVYDKAQSLLEIEADLVSGLHRLDGRTRISLSCSPSFGIAHLPTILREFMLASRDTADLKFIFNTPEQSVRGLKDGMFDLAVMEMCERFDLSAYETFPLAGDEMVFASASSLEIPAEPTSLEALLDTPLYVRREGCCSRMMLEDNLTSVGHHLHEFTQVIVFDDLHFIIKALLDGDGVAFLSRDVLTDYLASGRLVAHHVPGFSHQRERALIINHTAIFAGPLRDFVSTVFAHFSLDMPKSLPQPTRRS